MDNLPLELVHLVASYLEPPLAGYATLSLRWQRAIESRTFASVKTDSDDASFRQFQAIFAAPNRRSSLRKLGYHVQLPSPSEKRIRKMQSRREAATNCVVYTRALVALFSFLHTWGDEGKVALTVTVSSPMDSYTSNSNYNHRGEPIWHIRNSLKSVAFDMEVLQDSGGLATAPIITTLDENWSAWGRSRRVDPAARALLAKSLPNVRTMTWAFHSMPRRLPDARREERMSLANALFSLVATDLRFLTSLHLYWKDDDPYNEDFNPGNLLDGTSGRDDLSIALRRVGQLPSLQRLNLRGCHILSRQLFGDDRGDAPSTWPSLTRLEIHHMSTTTPDGRWYLTGDIASAEYAEDEPEDDPDESETAFDSDDSDTSDFAPEYAWERQDGMAPWCVFRRTPDSELCVPFLVSMFRAPARMPHLRRLEFTMQSDSRAGVVADYYGPGVGEDPGRYGDEKAFHDAHRGESRWVLFLCDVDAEWEIPPELRAALLESTGKGRVLVTVTTGPGARRSLLE